MPDLPHHNGSHAAGLELERVTRAIDEAGGLPNRYYTDPALRDLENQRLIAGTWAGAGFTKDVDEAGTMQPVHFMGVPLVMVRDKAGEIRVFENVCRHRGMILAEKAGKCSVIRCPYHAWTYGLDGRLRATPHIGGPGVHSHPRIDADSHSLNAVRAHVFLGVIFVNLDGNAPPFEDHARALLERWSDFADKDLYAGTDCGFSLTVHSNWKLAVENYCESYHLPFVHPELNRYSKLEDHYNIMQPGCFAGQGTTVYNPQLAGDGPGFADFSGLSDTWDRGAEYIALFPNTLLGVHRDHTFAMILNPQSVAQCREDVAIYYASDTAIGDDFSELRQKNAANWRSVFDEDIGVVEGMQRGRSGLQFDGGVFSPVMDGPTHCFHAWAAERLSAG
ncbi:MAG: aromatic ring-hydroxylating oxygenase subunit alpha [Alphaproteobacteria bacterium]